MKLFNKIASSCTLIPLFAVALGMSPTRTCMAEDTPFSSLFFIDSYIAGSSNNIHSNDRLYLTQPVKNNEYRLNLGAAGLAYDDSSFRAKLVGQYGDSVAVNYNGEPKDSFKYIQESYIGAYLDKDTYVDVGTFLSHIGAESWLSKDNSNYTRSYVAEFSPYYETGARIAHTFSDSWSGQFLVLNGWQNTSDNRHPALGTQVAWKGESGLTATSNTFIGNENYATRVFHDLIVGKTFKSGAQLVGSVDVGYEDTNAINSGWWWGYTLMGKVPVSDSVSLNARFEAYEDPNQVIVASANGGGFRANGASVGADVSLGHGFTVRGEVRELFAPHEIFIDSTTPEKNDTMYVLSLSFLDERKF